MPGSSSWLQNYRGQLYDTQAEQVTIDIEDRGSGNGTAAYTPIRLTGFQVQTVNNSQDPFNPILATSATITFRSTALINADTFSAGTDSRFFVEAYTSSVIIFRGFMLMDDIEERFINPAKGNIVTLTATDNIGTLKDLELIDNTTGEPLTDGHYPLRFLLQSCLNRTGLELPLNIVWNVFEEDMSDTESPLEQAFLHSLTFEKEIRSKEDCYTIIEKIASSLKARVFAYNGEWWFVRLHEYRREADTLRFIRYDSNGTLLDAFTDTSCAAEIARGELLHLINADALKVTQRPHKYDKDEYRYTYPLEVPRNRNFDRGDWISVLGLNPSYFNVAYWTLYQSHIGSYVTPDNTALIKRTYDANSVENSREIVISAGTPGDQYYLVSEEIPMHAGDKFSVGVDFRLSSDLSGPSGISYTPVLQIRLVGDDGSKWLWTDGTPASNNNYETNPRWVNVSTPGTFINLAHFIWAYWDLKLQKDTEWQSVSAEITPLPISGSVQLVLVHANPFLTYAKSFANLQFEYWPQINGTYAKYTGQYNKAEQSDPYKAKGEKDLAISDSPKKLFKGALKKDNGTAYVLTENWTDGFVNGYPDPARLGKLMVFDSWNQYRKPRPILSGTVKGVGNAVAYSLLFSRFTLSDYSLTKKFICLHFDLDVKRNEARAEFIEIHDTDDSNDYSTHEFNYLQ